MSSTSFFLFRQAISWGALHLFISTQGLKPSGPVSTLYCKRMGNDFRPRCALTTRLVGDYPVGKIAEELNLSLKQLFALSSDTDSL